MPSRWVVVEPLWSWAELVAATGGVAEGAAASGVTGVSIDTRTLQAGDLFVALRGDNQDGHVYVTKAFEKGASAALVFTEFVTPAGSGPLVRVDDTLKAMERLGVAARARLGDDARVIAVTGSAGKTSTKEMLRLCLKSVDPHTHASEKSYNNHWGVPLTLARMPRNTRYGVFEIGMNHAGEITPLTKMVRPHVAIITTVGPVHLGHFKSVEEIADAKAEIFAGLKPIPGSNDENVPRIAVLPADNEHFGRLNETALAAQQKVLTFGHSSNADFRMLSAGMGNMVDGMSVAMLHGDRNFIFYPGVSGEHHALNATAALAALSTIGVDPSAVLEAFEEFTAVAGRGARHTFVVSPRSIVLIDESYNANPLSMAAALDTIWRTTLAERSVRHIAVLGDMRELGDESARLHLELKGPVEEAHIDKVFACGFYMQALFDALPEAIQGAYAEKSEGLIAPLLAAIQPGDVIMIKGSLGTRMAPIVEAVKKHLTEWEKAGSKPQPPTSS